MATLYDIRENVRWYQHQAEMKELSEDEKTELEQIEEDREVLLEEIVKIVKNLESDIEVFAEAEREFRDKKHRAQKNVEYLRRQIVTDLMDSGEHKKRVGHFTIGTARKPGKIVVEDDGLVSDDFKKMKVEVSKSAIKDYIKTTGEIPNGVFVEKGFRLSIR